MIKDRRFFQGLDQQGRHRTREQIIESEFEPPERLGWIEKACINLVYVGVFLASLLFLLALAVFIFRGLPAILCLLDLRPSC
jgi:hypothetical protein